MVLFLFFLYLQDQPTEPVWTLPIPAAQGQIPEGAPASLDTGDRTARIKQLENQINDLIRKVEVQKRNVDQSQLKIWAIVIAGLSLVAAL